jgi:hypothetical protein
MYAIVEIAGQQFKVQQDQQIFVHRLDAAIDSKVDFDKSNTGIASQLSNWMEFWSQGNHDDRTLAIIY